MAVHDLIAPAMRGELTDELASLAEGLQRSTVQVRSGRMGGGSGVIWRADGLIITNAHVARGPQAGVELWDGREFVGEVVAYDRRRDLAALQINASGLPAAPIGSSDELRVGQLVLAVGNPLGLVGALTSGIVHALGAPDAGRPSWVSADIHLAPGNSGGPLADAGGNVIGINSMVSGGLGLAVPSNAVQRFLRFRGQRPSLGLTLQPVLVPTRQGRQPGLVVLEVALESPAAAAGLSLGNVIIGVDGHTFQTPHDFARVLDESAGALTLELLHGGKHLTRTISLPAEPITREAA